VYIRVLKRRTEKKIQIKERAWWRANFVFSNYFLFQNTKEREIDKEKT
jgi:intracellular septation protein A